MSAHFMSNLRVAAEEHEQLRAVRKFVEQGENCGGVYGRFDVEIEHEFKVTAGYRAALKLCEVESEDGELRDERIERAGSVRQGEHEAYSVCAGEDHGFL